MKKTISLASLYLILFVGSCIPDRNISSYIRTITSIDAKLFLICDSCYFYYNTPFDENNKQYLNILLSPKSFTQKIEASLHSKLNNSLFANDPVLPKIIYTNHIDSLAIYTLYDYDETHPANTLINNILTHKPDYNIPATPIDSLESIEFNKYNEYYYGEGIVGLKVTSPVTASDSVQFRVTGKLSDGVQFDTTTELMVFNAQ